MKHLALRSILAVALIAGFSVPIATAYPDKPIKIIIPFKPGGGADTNAQLFKRALEENKLLPQPTVVVHVPGAGGNIGAKRAIGEKPDGYTILQTIVILASNQALGNIDFGPTDFIPVAAAGDSCIVVSVMESSPYKSLKQLLDAAKAKPDTITLGINIGGINHITARMLEEAHPGAKFRLANVGGGAKNFTALVGGHTETTPFSAVDFTRFRVKGIRGLAYTGATRHPVLPKIATTKELGLPSVDFCFAHWWLAPKGTPKDRTDTLANALEKAFATDLVQAKWKSLSMTPNFMKGAAAAERIKKDTASVLKVFKK